MINVITLYTGSTSNRFTSRQMNYEAINRKAKRGEEHMQSPVYYFITLENVFVSFCEIYLFNSRTNDIQPLVFEHFSSNGFLEDCSIIFSAFGLNTERYGVSLRIQSECGKIRTRITPNTDIFHAVSRTPHGLITENLMHLEFTQKTSVVAVLYIFREEMVFIS